MSARPEDVLAVLEQTSAGLWSVANNCTRSDLSTAMRARAEEFDRSRAAVAKMVAVKRRLEGVRELCGAVEDGSCQTVSIGQDDATRSWIVSVGGKFFAHAPTFDAALDAALARMQDGAQ